MISQVLLYDLSKEGAPVPGAPLLGTQEDLFDPYLNLAREEVLLHHLKPGQILLYLWQNQNTVVIGKNQNCFKECHVSLLESEGGHLARRLSGGGAVFHDLGNLNYTFLAYKEDFDIKRQTKVILEAVKSFGIEAEASGRNDITVDGKKFSGNAYYLSKEACYQHGTILINIDGEKIARYLSVSREKLASKGVASVRSRVTGLHLLSPDVTVASMKQALEEACSKEYGLPITLANDKIIEQEAAMLRERYASDAWLYGSKTAFTYSFEKRFSWGGVEVSLKVDKGIIQEAKVYTDALATGWPQAVEALLTGCPCRITSLKDLAVDESSREEAQLIRDTIRLVIDSL